MKKSKNPNCHCDGSGYWKNPFDQEFKCACNKKKKSKAKGLTTQAIDELISKIYWSMSKDYFIPKTKAARGGNKRKDLL